MKIIGLLMLASPFILMSYFMIKTNGWDTFFVVWGIVIAVVLIGTTGVYLVSK